MINKTQKNIRVCSIIVLVLCVLWAVFEVFYFVGLLTGKGGVAEKVNWSENKTTKIVFFILYLVSTVMMIVLCFKVIINVLKGLREQVVFPQNNVKPLLWLASVSFVYMLCWMNQPILRGVISIHLQGANFIMPFLLLFFAFMYKVAADAVEENNLTIWAMIILNLDVMLAKRKMRSNELAERIGLTQANLSILKTGKAKAIRLTTLDAICRELQCTPGDILEYKADEE